MMAALGQNNFTDFGNENESNEQQTSRFHKSKLTEAPFNKIKVHIHKPLSITIERVIL